MITDRENVNHTHSYRKCFKYHPLFSTFNKNVLLKVKKVTLKMIKAPTTHVHPRAHNSAAGELNHMKNSSGTSMHADSQEYKVALQAVKTSEIVPTNFWDQTSHQTNGPINQPPGDSNMWIVGSSYGYSLVFLCVIINCCQCVLFP